MLKSILIWWLVAIIIVLTFWVAVKGMKGDHDEQDPRPDHDPD